MRGKKVRAAWIQFAWDDWSTTKLSRICICVKVWLSGRRNGYACGHRHADKTVRAPLPPLACCVLHGLADRHLKSLDAFAECGGDGHHCSFANFPFECFQ